MWSVDDEETVLASANGGVPAAACAGDFAGAAVRLRDGGRRDARHRRATCPALSSAGASLGSIAPSQLQGVLATFAAVPPKHARQWAPGDGEVLLHGALAPTALLLDAPRLTGITNWRLPLGTASRRSTRRVGLYVLRWPSSNARSSVCRSRRRRQQC